MNSSTYSTYSSSSLLWFFLTGMLWLLWFSAVNWFYCSKYSKLLFYWFLLFFYSADLTVFSCFLSVTPSPSDTKPVRDGEVTLECSLLRYKELQPCKEKSILWVDETGRVLNGKGVGFEFLRQTDCVSYLSVKRQSGHNRKYTCLFIDQGQKLIEAEYTPVFTSDTGEDLPEKLDSGKIIYTKLCLLVSQSLTYQSVFMTSILTIETLLMGWFIHLPI